MPVSTDQRAILELLLKHDVGYEAIGRVLSTGTDGARARTRAALSAISDLDAEVDDRMADFLLGRAVAAQQVADVQWLAEDAEANRLARRIADALRVEFEDVEPPRIPELRVPPVSQASPNGDGAQAIEAPRRRWPRLTARRGVAAVILVSAAAALTITAVLPGEDLDSSSSETEAPAEEATSVAGIEDRIPLRPAQAGETRGEAVIAFNSNSRPYLEFDLEHVEPAPPGQLHLFWLDVDGDKGLPMPPPIPIAENGSYHDRLGLPVDLLQALDQSESLDLVVMPADELRELRQRFEETGGADLAGGSADLPDHPGGTVLSGSIPDLASAAAAG